MGRWWLVVGLMVALALLSIVLFLTSSARRFEQARQVWAASEPGAYRLTFTHDYMVGDFLGSSRSCRATIEVRAGEATHLIAGDCPELLTVDMIFARFAPYVGAAVPSRRCGYGTCLCEVSTFRADYDAVYGFPTAISRDWRDQTVGRGQFWSMAAQLPGPIRTMMHDLAAARSPCPPGTLNHTPNISPIHRERITILAVEPLD